MYIHTHLPTYLPTYPLSGENSVIRKSDQMQYFNWKRNRGCSQEIVEAWHRVSAHFTVKTFLRRRKLSYSRGWSTLVGVRMLEPPHLNKLSPFTFPNTRCRIWSGTHACMIAILFRSGLLFWRTREVRYKVLYLFDSFFSRVEAIAVRSALTILRLDRTLPTAPIIVESTTLFFLRNWLWA